MVAGAGGDVFGLGAELGATFAEPGVERGQIGEAFVGDRFAQRRPEPFGRL